MEGPKLYGGPQGRLAVVAKSATLFKAAYSVTMNIFRKKKNLFKSFVKVEVMLSQ